MNVLIYGKRNCQYCNEAVKLCKQNGIEYTYKEVGVDITKEKLFENLGKEVKSVPQIVIYSDGFGEHVGGYAEFKKRLEN